MRSLWLALFPALLACATASKPATTEAVPPRQRPPGKTLLVLVMEEEKKAPCAPGALCPVFNLEEVDERMGRNRK